MKGSICDLIPRGREKSISMPDLSVRLNVDPRTLRAIIQREREQGAPICSDWEQGGYYMPADKSEALRYYRAQNARIRSARAALNGIRAFLKGGANND